jgi:hypothetical protein
MQRLSYPPRSSPSVHRQPEAASERGPNVAVGRGFGTDYRRFSDSVQDSVRLRRYVHCYGGDISKEYTRESSFLT